MLRVGKAQKTRANVSGPACPRTLPFGYAPPVVAALVLCKHSGDSLEWMLHPMELRGTDQAVAWTFARMPAIDQPGVRDGAQCCFSSRSREQFAWNATTWHRKPRDCPAVCAAIAPGTRQHVPRPPHPLNIMQG